MTHVVPGRVPVEHRFAGLDRRSFKYAVPVIILALLWSFIVPAINHAVRYDDPVRPGDIMSLGNGITFVPVPGWGVQAGLRVTDRAVSGADGGPVTLVKGGTVFNMTPAPWTGAPASLLDQVNQMDLSLRKGQGYRLASNQAPFLTNQGVPGLIETFTTTHDDGIRAAIVFGQTGVAIYAAGPPTEITAQLDEIESMIASVGVYQPERQS